MLRGTIRKRPLTGLREAIKKKKLRNFGHCPKRGGRVSTAAKLFIEKRYGHMYRGGGGGLELLVQNSF